jgi:hypothetical protein
MLLISSMLVPDPKINAATFFSFFNYKRFTQMSDGWFAAQNLDLEKIQKNNEEKRRKSSISSKKVFHKTEKESDKSCALYRNEDGPEEKYYLF